MRSLRIRQTPRHLRATCNSENILFNLLTPTSMFMYALVFHRPTFTILHSFFILSSSILILRFLFRSVPVCECVQVCVHAFILSHAEPKRNTFYHPVVITRRLGDPHKARDVSDETSGFPPRPPSVRPRGTHRVPSRAALPGGPPPKGNASQSLPKVPLPSKRSATAKSQ